jgi:hypothetical protein
MSRHPTPPYNFAFWRVISAVHRLMTREVFYEEGRGFICLRSSGLRICRAW